jgi:hypothetical protein
LPPTQQRHHVPRAVSTGTAYTSLRTWHLKYTAWHHPMPRSRLVSGSETGWSSAMDVLDTDPVDAIAARAALRDELERIATMSILPSIRNGSLLSRGSVRTGTETARPRLMPRRSAAWTGRPARVRVGALQGRTPWPRCRRVIFEGIPDGVRRYVWLSSRGRRRQLRRGDLCRLRHRPPSRIRSVGLTGGFFGLLSRRPLIGSNPGWQVRAVRWPPLSRLAGAPWPRLEGYEFARGRTRTAETRALEAAAGGHHSRDGIRKICSLIRPQKSQCFHINLMNIGLRRL